jgi:hypothetical protein
MLEQADVAKRVAADSDEIAIAAGLDHPDVSAA